MKRQIIHIDQEKCNGCGACAAACHEGAIAMVDGKARLMRDDYCDGLGDCLPASGGVEQEVEAAALAESMTNFGFDRALYGFEREGFSAIRDAYKARCVNLGRHVTFDGGEGTALDVDEEGRLVVQGAEGSTHVFTGEVSVHGIYGAV